jgi:hypothetical protein
MNELDAITARLALSDAKARYCRMLDTKDWAGYAALLTEDFVLDVSEGTQVPVITGRDAAVEQIKSSILTARTAHQVHTPEIRLNADEAQVIWPMQDRVVWSADRPSITGYGHYHERWVRRNGEWKLAALRLTRLHIDVHPPTKVGA